MASPEPGEIIDVESEDHLGRPRLVRGEVGADRCAAERIRRVVASLERGVHRLGGVGEPLRRT